MPGMSLAHKDGARGAVGQVSIKPSASVTLELHSNYMKTNSVPRVSFIPEAKLRILEAALDAPNGFLGDISVYLDMSVSETARLARELIADGYLLGLDCEPWAVTLKGYELIRDSRQAKRTHLASSAVATVNSSQIGKQVAQSKLVNSDSNSNRRKLVGVGKRG